MHLRLNLTLPEETVRLVSESDSKKGLCVEPNAIFAWPKNGSPLKKKRHGKETEGSLPKTGRGVLGEF